MYVAAFYHIVENFIEGKLGEWGINIIWVDIKTLIPKGISSEMPIKF